MSYGEPWRLCCGSCNNIRTCNDEHVGTGADREETDRIIACVNACSTIKNPAAIPYLITLARNIKSWPRSITDDLYDDIKNQLATLDAEPGQEDGR